MLQDGKSLKTTVTTEMEDLGAVAALRDDVAG